MITLALAVLRHNAGRNRAVRKQIVFMAFKIVVELNAAKKWFHHGPLFGTKQPFTGIFFAPVSLASAV
jgi:hypothetical protein